MRVLYIYIYIYIYICITIGIRVLGLLYSTLIVRRLLIVYL